MCTIWKCFLLAAVYVWSPALTLLKPAIPFHLQRVIIPDPLDLQTICFFNQWVSSLAFTSRDLAGYINFFFQFALFKVGTRRMHGQDQPAQFQLVFGPKWVGLECGPPMLAVCQVYLFPGPRHAAFELLISI